jgi:hypothetical protein
MIFCCQLSFMIKIMRRDYQCLYTKSLSLSCRFEADFEEPEAPEEVLFTISERLS